jgi:tRNA1Val (adenine37-N6)-methyltransferase
MGSKPFQFKQFSVAQDRSTHKVGTDGVLLGAWVRLHADIRSVLDVGTGTGLIALMLAQRTSENTTIDAVEVEEEDARQAKENVQHSPWAGKIRIHISRVQDFLPEKKYDLVISNPPYFVNSWLPPENKRSQARHAQLLPFEDLLRHSHRLLAPGGRLAVILPYTEGLMFINLARSFGLFPSRRTAFRSRAHKPLERVLVELSSEGGYEQPENELVLYTHGDTWSDEYRSLTRAFYLREQD